MHDISGRLSRFFCAAIAAATVFVAIAPARAQETPEEPKPMSAATFAGLAFRSIGPALMSGRVGDFAVNPNDRSHYYAAICSGGVWKTTNAGITWTPVFDGQGSYSIGCITMDPTNTNVVWVGTGENNSQRSVSFGDGVYKTLDGGASWTNLGLKDSEHIGMIAIDPRDTDVVYVAAQGPLWRSGGDRGLYKTTDGGKSWTRVLHISDDTGVNEVHLDPRNPDAIYASAYQRRRHVWTLINGGPESAIYKSEDAGTNWRKITKGIPTSDKGRIGLDISPANPDILYAIIEAQDKDGGVFRSTDRGETWEKRNDFVASSPQYYNEIVCDPLDPDRVYFLETFMRVTEDGAKTIKRVPRNNRHVDDHALWIDPHDTSYMIVGCDGGIYETFDRGEHWAYKANLPITQFYRLCIDNSEPFYYIYGGTQDNNTIGGPTRTTDRIGISNADWFITVGGDGFEPQVDPEDPMTVYSQWQYGGLVRYDRRTGEVVDIKPREKPGEPGLKWNWDSPLIISPHDHKRLYYAANILYRSNDRGDSWQAVSEDLTRRVDRNELEVMGRIQPADAVAKHNSTSMYGNIVSLAESPLVENLIYVGTDDGLVQVTEDGGENWRRIDLFPGVPDYSYVSYLVAGRHDADTVFAAFDNHKNGDFKPYLLVSHDRGKSWESIAGDLPARDIVYAVAEDHEKPELLFAGTEFGAYFTIDGGTKWIKLKGGIPTIAVRDMEIQRRENDLALATFGRGFYVLDDYAPLRHVSEEAFEQDAVLFPVKDALWYVESNRLGGNNGKGSQGAALYAADNPPFGAVFTYYLKDKLKTKKEARREAEKKAEKAKQTTTYPAIEELQVEDEQIEPSIVLEVRDEEGDVVRRVPASREKGLHRVAWDLRFSPVLPINLSPPGDLPPWVSPPRGPLALPGEYTVTLTKEVDGEITTLADAQSFKVVPLSTLDFTADDFDEIQAFRMKTARLRRAVRGTLNIAGETESRLTHLRAAYFATPNAAPELLEKLDALRARYNALMITLRGNETRRNRNEPDPPSIVERVEQVAWDQWYVTSPPTQTQRDAYAYASDAFAQCLIDMRTLVEDDLAALESEFEKAGAPWTPGRLPEWSPE